MKLDGFNCFAFIFANIEISDPENESGRVVVVPFAVDRCQADVANKCTDVMMEKDPVGLLNLSSKLAEPLNNGIKMYFWNELFISAADTLTNFQSNARQKKWLSAFSYESIDKLRGDVWMLINADKV